MSKRVEAAHGGPTLPEQSSEDDARKSVAPSSPPAEFAAENLPAAWPSCHGTARFVEVAAAHAAKKHATAAAFPQRSRRSGAPTHSSADSIKF